MILNIIYKLITIKKIILFDTIKMMSTIDMVNMIRSS